MSMPKVTKFINAPPRKRLVEVNLVNAGSPEGGLRYCATLQATSEGKRSGLRDRLWALGASQTQLTRLSKRPWIDCRQPRLTISRYKGLRLGLQVHYAPSAKETTDQTEVGIYLASGLIKKNLRVLFGDRKDIEILPGGADQ